jgi:hypothetical protein
MAEIIPRERAQDNRLCKEGLPMWGGIPGEPNFFRTGWQMVLRWLSSPVIWTMIVLVVSGLGIYRELF